MTKIEILNLQIQAYLGLPYLWGGATPITGFDCSGFVLELLQSIGFWANKQDGSSQEIADHFAATFGLTPQYGSLLFFGKSRENITHITFALSDKFMVEASSGDSTTINRDIAIKQQAYIKVRPISHRIDLVAIHHLNLEE